MANLTVDEVRARLVSYDPHGTTDELYEFGKMLVGECVDRLHKIDAKATMVTGYSGTIIALMVSTSSLWKPTIDKWAVGVVFGAAFAALMASVCALWSFRSQTFQWFSDREWMDKDYLADPDQLRRYHVLTMYNVVTSHEAIGKKKNASLKSAQRLLGLSTFLLVVALFDAIWKSPV